MSLHDDLTDELEQRIQIALDLLNPQNHICNCDPDVDWICEPCFIRGVICDMKRERERTVLRVTELDVEFEEGE